MLATIFFEKEKQRRIAGTPTEELADALRPMVDVPDVPGVDGVVFVTCFGGGVATGVAERGVEEDGADASYLPSAI